MCSGWITGPVRNADLQDVAPANVTQKQESSRQSGRSADWLRAAFSHRRRPYGVMRSRRWDCSEGARPAIPPVFLQRGANGQTLPPPKRPRSADTSYSGSLLLSVSSLTSAEWWNVRNVGMGNLGRRGRKACKRTLKAGLKSWGGGENRRVLAPFFFLEEVKNESRGRL